MEQDTRTAKELIAAAGESVRGHSYGLDTLLVIAEEEGWSADRAQRLLAGCESLRDSRARIAELERERDEARGRAVGWRNAMRSLRNVVGEIAAVVQKGNHESTADAVRRALEAVDGAEESPAPEAQAGTTVAQEREEPVAAPRPVGADGIGVGKDSAITKLVDELIAERDALRSEVERLRAESAWVPCSERTPGPEGDYLCSFANGFGEAWVAAGYWRSLEWVGQRGGKVVARAPLPAPYTQEVADA